MNATQNTYNGWTNYETWRIALEFFDGAENPTGETDAHQLGKDLKDIVQEAITQYGENTIATAYALAFISDVNFQEIAEHILEMNEEQ
jgi:hypothetical protein